MTTIVLLGGNEYIGRAVIKQWLKKDPKAHFYIVSRRTITKNEKSPLIFCQRKSAAIDIWDYPIN